MQARACIGAACKARRQGIWNRDCNLNWWEKVYGSLP
jgi:hypothetical protein